jgi:hypothetical protein
MGSFAWPVSILAAAALIIPLLAADVSSVFFYLTYLTPPIVLIAAVWARDREGSVPAMTDQEPDSGIFTGS